MKKKYQLIYPWKDDINSISPTKEMLNLIAPIVTCTSDYLSSVITAVYLI